MLESIANFFSGNGFMPHGHCYLWNPGLIWLHVASDALIALAYTSIPFTLLHFVRRRTDMPFHWMFLCFGAFIVACGATHALEIVTLWTPVYWLSGAVKAITAAASVPTAVLLVRLVPRALAIPSPADLRKAHEQLRGAHDELEAFSYSVAHDLRAPLRAIDGFSRVLCDEHRALLNADGLECLSEIMKNAERMAALIDALLALARVARMEVNAEGVDLAELARSSLARLRAAEPARKVELVVPDRLPARLDVNLAQTLVDNLVGNAWKFTAHTSEPRIEVGVTNHLGAPTYFVRDNGTGFDPAYANRLFTPFQRLHSASAYPGHGVGLATVQRIVQRHGGRVDAEGAIGHGATFYFSLPATPAGEGA